MFSVLRLNVLFSVAVVFSPLLMVVMVVEVMLLSVFFRLLEEA